MQKHSIKMIDDVFGGILRNTGHMNRIMARTCMHHAPHMYESWHTHACVMPHICMSHGTEVITACVITVSHYSCLPSAKES